MANATVLAVQKAQIEPKCPEVSKRMSEIPMQRLMVAALKQICIALLLINVSYAVAQSAEVDFIASEERAKAFFLSSVYRSLERVQATDKPVQVDLYILVHFLMYNDTLRFTDKKTASELSDSIVRYFDTTAPENVWQEGCLAAKLLIALIRKKRYAEMEDRLLKRYSAFISKQWEQGIGECFVPSISRSYGNDMPGRNCTPPTQELAAKMAYYLVSSGQAGYQPDLRYINETVYENIENWWHANVELWVIETYRLPRQRYISPQRYRQAVERVERALEQKQYNTLTASLLVHAWLLSHARAEPQITAVLVNVAKTQDKRGAIPSVIAADDKPEHNFDATPTYLYLLALHELKKQGGI